MCCIKQKQKKQERKKKIQSPDVSEMSDTDALSEGTLIAQLRDLENEALTFEQNIKDINTSENESD